MKENDLDKEHRKHQLTSATDKTLNRVFSFASFPLRLFILDGCDLRSLCRMAMLDERLQRLTAWRHVSLELGARLPSKYVLVTRYSHLYRGTAR